MPLQCPLWVKSGHRGQLKQCLLYPQKQTLELSRAMSALCQKRTHAVQHKTDRRRHLAADDVSMSGLETSTADAEYFLDLFEHFAEGSRWLARFKLVRQLNKMTIGGDDALRQNLRNVTQHDWVFIG